MNYDQFPYRRIHTPSPNLSAVNLHQACPLKPYSTILEGNRLYLAMEKKPINSSPAWLEYAVVIADDAFSYLTCI